MTIVYPMKIEEEIMPIIELKSREEHSNKAIVLKQLLYKGLESYLLDLIAKGRLTIGRAAEILGVSIYDIQEMAKSKDIKLTASQEQRQKSRKYVKEFLGRVA